MKRKINKFLRKRGLEVSFKIQEFKVSKMVYSEVEKILYYQILFNYIKNVEGDIVECGVGKGRSLLFFSYLIKFEMKNRVLWGFDSFEGFPEPSIEDKSKRNPKKGEWGDTSISRVLKTLYDGGIDDEFVKKKIILIKGFFNESLKKYKGKKIALLHIDVDLYRSYLDVLSQLYDKVITGGIILFDEYISTSDQEKFPGAQRAIDEFLSDKNVDIRRDSATGKYFLIKP